jgi:N-acetylmuramoyl-L-alanine amidase CwlA
MGEEIFGQFTRVADTVEKQYHQTPGNWIIKKLCSTKSELLAPANQTTMAGVNMNEEKSGNISRAAEKEQAKAIDALNEERQKKVSFA